MGCLVGEMRSFFRPTSAPAVWSLHRSSFLRRVLEWIRSSWEWAYSTSMYWRSHRTDSSLEFRFSESRTASVCKLFYTYRHLPEFVSRSRPLWSLWHQAQSQFSEGNNDQRSTILKICLSRVFGGGWQRKSMSLVFNRIGAISKFLFLMPFHYPQGLFLLVAALRPLQYFGSRKI